MKAVLPAARGRPVCRFCGGGLDPHQAARGAVCAEPNCERQRIQEASRAVFQRNWNDYVERQRRAAEQAAPQVARALQKLKARPERTAIGVVPHLDRPLVPLPPNRRTGVRELEERRSWSRDRLIAAVVAEGFELESRESIEQYQAATWLGYVERLEQRAFSSLITISDAAFEAGLSSLRRALPGLPAGEVWEPVDFFVFRS